MQHAQASTSRTEWHSGLRATLEVAYDEAGVSGMQSLHSSNSGLERGLETAWRAQLGGGGPAGGGGQSNVRCATSPKPPAERQDRCPGLPRFLAHRRGGTSAGPSPARFNPGTSFAYHPAQPGPCWWRNAGQPRQRCSNPSSDVIHRLEQELDDLDQRTCSTLRRSPAWREKDELLRSVPGVGCIKRSISKIVEITAHHFGKSSGKWNLVGENVPPIRACCIIYFPQSSLPLRSSTVSAVVIRWNCL